MNKIINKIKEIYKNHKKIVLISGILLIFIIIALIIMNVVSNRNTINYNGIDKLMREKDTFLIYYYNSKSDNKNNKEIKQYLDKLGIRYFNYNDIHIDREEYDNFARLIGIDKKLLGVPSLIFIKDGKMYGNIMNVDSKVVVDKFIESYDLYHVK